MATLLEQKQVKTRKPHVCRGCGIKIEVGQQANVSKTVGDDGIYSLYECDECFAYAEANCHGCGDFYYCIGENYMIGLIKECQIEKTKHGGDTQ